MTVVNCSDTSLHSGLYLQRRLKVGDCDCRRVKFLVDRLRWLLSQKSKCLKPQNNSKSKETCGSRTKITSKQTNYTPEL